ncbi:hypothetical protein PINS_up000724 [Pythium insidiosum]|nr:hypothetical protein PINS_up000724 [Pythium insidiosum]
MATLSSGSEAADILQHHGLGNGANCVTVGTNDSSVRSEPCHAGDSQLFELYANRMLRSGVDGGRCLEYSASDSSVRAAKCEDGKWEQMWRVRYDDSIIPMGFGISGKCLDGAVGSGDSTSPSLALAPCDAKRPSQVFRSSILTPDRGVTLSFDGKCLSAAWSAGDSTPSSFACHQDFNQVWSYTADDELRVLGDRCLQHDVATLTTVAVAACDGSSQQKWDVDSTTGRIMPQWSMERCLDLSTSPPTLAYCGNGVPPSAVLDSYGLILAREGRMRRTLLRASSLSDRLECVAAPSGTSTAAAAAVTLSPCRADPPFWWEFASGMAVKTAGNKCLDMVQSGDGLSVVASACNQQDTQKWNWDARTGAITSPHALAQGKCVTYTTSGRALTLDACNPWDPKPAQLFRPKPFSQFPPPSRADAQNAYCSQRSSAGSDVGFLRDTLFYHNDMTYLVPSTLSGREASSYYSSVVFDSLSVVLTQETGALREGWLFELLQRSTDGVRVLIDLAELMCVVRERDAELRPKITAWFNVNSREPNRRLLEEANFLRMAALQLQLAALPSTSVLVRVFSDSVAASVSKHLSALADIDAVVRYVTSEDMVWFAKLLQPTCASQPQLKICAPLQWSRLVSARRDLLEAVDVAVNASGKTNELMPSAVMLAADALVQVYREGLGKDSPIEAKTWTAFAQYVVFGSTQPVTKYSLSDLLRTTTKKEMVLVLALWPFFTSEEMAGAWGPHYAALSDQLYNERRRELERVVYGSSVTTLEAYMDGRLSDTALLVTNVLSRICSRFSTTQTFRVCALTKYHTLTSARAELQRMIKAANGTLTPDIEKTAVQFVQVFGANAATVPEEDKNLWTHTALRLLFDSVELTIYPPKTLLASARADRFLLSYVVFAAFDKGLAPVLPAFTFLIDQVSMAHFNAINQLIGDRDVVGMAAYVQPNSSSSDLAVLGRSVLPRLCFNPNNPEFSVCKLMEFYTGLLQVVTFEKSRFAPVVPLSELAEVDVRKQLDVIDQENKHFEVINAIQDSANQIGKKIQEESEKIQDVVKQESAAIRHDIDVNTKALEAKMDQEARVLQAAIKESTRTLEKTIGAAADSIRKDIADSTKLLYKKMDDDSRALYDSITENTRKLSQQIGAEAAATRSLIKDSTDKLYNKMDADGRAILNKIDTSTRTLYSKIGEEGRSIRDKIDASTDKLYQKIGDEGIKTRDKIDASTRELTNVINTSTSKLEGKIDASTGKIVGTFKTGFTALADYYKSNAKVTGEQLVGELKTSIAVTSRLRSRVQALQTQTTAALEDAGNAAARLSGMQVLSLSFKLSAVASSIGGLAGASCAPGLGHLTCDPNRLQAQLAELQQLNDRITRLTDESTGVRARSLSLVFATTTVAHVANAFAEWSGPIQRVVTIVEQIASPPTAADTVALVEGVLVIYDTARTKVSTTDLATFETQCMSFIEYIVLMVQRVSGGAPGGAAADVVRRALLAKDTASNLIATLHETYAELMGQIEKLGQLARAASSSQAASSLETAATGLTMRRHRGLQRSATFKPLYSMVYAGLSKLFMQYRIQHAALQFCHFYEYKLGGVAPSMCTNTGAFFSPSDIQKMRAYQPPALTSSWRIAMLPTRPTPSTLNANVTHPYVDLDRLASGQDAVFQLPVTDIAWLQTMGWLLPSDTTASLRGLYIQSMQLVLPYTATAGGDTPERFFFASTIAVGSTNVLNPSSNSTYLLPKTTIEFSASINEPICANELVNPYHAAARCVYGDGSSTLCVFDEGTVARADLLPSIFSAWTISPAVTAGKGYKLALPPRLSQNASDGGVDLNLLVRVKVARVQKTTTSEAAAEAAEVRSASNRAAPTTCCPRDEFFKQNKCIACPLGSVGALNGFSCQRAASA